MVVVGEMRQLAGWIGSTVTSATVDGNFRMELGEAGYLVVFTAFEVDVSGSVATIDPLEGQAVLALEGLTVTGATIGDLGQLRVTFGLSSIFVEPDEKFEAFQLSELGGPHLLVCGMGGEIFEWA
jgi:hypothetical protein